MDTARTDIGHGLTAALRLSEGFPDLKDGVPVGVLLTHVCSKRNGERVEDFIPIDYPGNTFYWRLSSIDPITLHPSIHCTCCGIHGFVISGRWIPA